MAVVAGVLAFSQPAGAAATVTFGAVIKDDGTAAFDGTDMSGNDSGAHNGIVRTLDLVTYELTIGNSGLGNDINQTTVSSTLPVGMVWSALDSTCRLSSAIPAPVPASSISADRRTIVCNIGSRLAGSLVRLPLQAYPLTTVPDGTTKTASFTLDFNDPGASNARISAPGGSVSVIVSAGKPFDLSHNDNVAPVFGLQYNTSTALLATTSPTAGTVTDHGAPLAGAVVGLFDSNGNARIDPTTSLPYAATTDASGNYGFAAVTSGTTSIRVISGAPVGGVVAGTMSYLVTVQGQGIDADFDYVTPSAGTTPGTISGKLFSDVNHDGVLGAEPGIDDVTLTLTGFDSTGNPVTRTAVTTSTGTYSFSVPPSGANGYRIVPTGRKVSYYLPVVTNEFNVHMGDAQVRTVDIPWNTDTDRGKLFVTRFPLALKAPVAGKGVSAASGPISWTEDVPAGTTVSGCGRQGQTVNNSPLPNGSGGGTYAVPNSGTWTCTQPGGPGTPISVTVNGADTAGTTFPTRSWNNQTAIPANDRFLATGWIGISQPDPGCGITVAARTVSSTNFAATTIGGAALTDPIATTNTATAPAAGPARNCPSLPGNSGFMFHDKRFTKDDSHGWTGVTNDLNSTSNLYNTRNNPQVPSGSPFGTYIRALNNQSVWDATDVVMCDKFDLTRFKLYNRPGVTPATPFQLAITNPQSPFANRLLVQSPSTAAFDAATATSGAFVVEIGMGSPYASLAAQQSGSCNSGALIWQAWNPAVPMSQTDLDSAVAFRLRAKAFQPSDQI